jgi:hypothetical protein
MAALLTWNGTDRRRMRQPWWSKHPNDGMERLYWPAQSPPEEGDKCSPPSSLLSPSNIGKPWSFYVVLFSPFSVPCLYVYFQNNTVNSIVCNDITRFFSFLNGLPIPLDDLTCKDQKYLASSMLICLEFSNKYSLESCQNILCIVQ